MTRLCSLRFAIAPEEGGRNAFAKLFRERAVLSLRSFKLADHLLAEAVRSLESEFHSFVKGGRCSESNPHVPWSLRSFSESRGSKKEYSAE